MAAPDYSNGVRCMLMRGGTSKGAYFVADELPSDPKARDDLILRIMGSPDPRQIDGIGGAHPLTSKVAVVSRSSSADADLDYLFLQVGVDEATVTDRQTCGNLLAGVAPFAIERGLIDAVDGITDVRIRTLNADGGLTVAKIQTPGRKVNYAGDTLLSGVPFGAAAIPLEFPRTDTALLPTGAIRDEFDGIEVTCVNAGMPVVVVAASSLGATGYETPTELEENRELAKRVEKLRLAAGIAMGLGDVSKTTVPKISLVAAPRNGGTLSTRTFIPKRVHTSIGVLGAVSVAAAALIPGSVAEPLAKLGKVASKLRIEHPTGYFDVEAEVRADGDTFVLERSAVVRTARKLFDGIVWPR
jgi:4-oxalomesaconate tautomerase